jgi:hypothetical protein
MHGQRWASGVYSFAGRTHLIAWHQVGYDLPAENPRLTAARSLQASQKRLRHSHHYGKYAHDRLS